MTIQQKIAAALREEGENVIELADGRLLIAPHGAAQAEIDGIIQSIGAQECCGQPATCDNAACESQREHESATMSLKEFFDSLPRCSRAPMAPVDEDEVIELHPRQALPMAVPVSFDDPPLFEGPASPVEEGPTATIAEESAPWLKLNEEEFRLDDGTPLSCAILEGSSHFGPSAVVSFKEDFDESGRSEDFVFSRNACLQLSSMFAFLADSIPNG